jgi:chromosome segregation ATPase
MFAASIAFETLPMIAANPKFKFAPFARQIEEASGFTISERTAKNASVTANQLQLKYAALIGSYENGHTEENVTAFVARISEEIKAAGFVLTLDDVNAFCKGEKSAAAKRAEAAAAAEAAAEALAKAKEAAAAAEKTRTDAELEQAKKQQADAEAAQKQAETAKAEAEAAAAKAEEAKAEAAKRAEAIKAEAAKAEAEAAAAKAEAAKQKAAAEEARKVAESFAVSVQVNADGTPNIVVGLNPSADFLMAVSKELAKMAKALKAKQAEVMAEAA